jgi:hypothetical protein
VGRWLDDLYRIREAARETCPQLQAGMHVMNRFYLVLIAAALVGLAPCEATASTYFPSRPANAQLQYVTGVLTHYGLGNDSGTITIRDSVGVETDVKMARTMMVNGTVIVCTIPASCAQWPSSITLGTTVVTLTCWLDSRSSRSPMLVSDQIDIGTSPLARHRKLK